MAGNMIVGTVQLQTSVLEYQDIHHKNLQQEQKEILKKRQVLNFNLQFQNNNISKLELI